MNKVFLTSLAFIFLISSCKKNSFITSAGALVNFSSDTLKFDTVFTSVGSITQSVKIINQNNQKLMLSEISLAGGAVSPFKINIDGAPGPAAKNIELGANDSLYVFVTVNVNPAAGTLPFVLEDSIQVSYNGNQHYIQLQAWGQNAIFLRNTKITVNTVWPDTLPYVILGGLLVDSNATLTIQKGCKIYLHANAPFLIDGTLLVQGEKYDSTKIYFQGDRLDAPYNSFPGSWPGLFFRTTSKDNILEFAVLKNAYQGVVAEDPSSDGNPKITLNECILDDIFDAAILGVHTSIQAQNCLVSNSGKNIVLGYGGNYNFTHCTVASFSNNYILHQYPVLNIGNYALQGNNTLVNDITSTFTNCIFWGDFGAVDDEVVTSLKGNTIFKVSFANCLWKIKTEPAGVDTAKMVVNADPVFVNINTQNRVFDFHLNAGSPAIDKGIDTGIPFDLDGSPRAVGLPDLGCYEKQ
jgi:hypothetical protein